MSQQKGLLIMGKYLDLAKSVVDKIPKSPAEDLLERMNKGLLHMDSLGGYADSENNPALRKKQDLAIKTFHEISEEYDKLVNTEEL